MKRLACGVRHARRSAGAALELVADHARAAADIALGDRSRDRAVQRGERMFGSDREARRIAEPAVIGLRHDRQQPGHRHLVAHGECADRIAHHADRVCVGYADGRRQQSLFGDPCPAGHLAIAVEGVDAGEHRIGPQLLTARPDRGDARPHDRWRVMDQRRVADAHAGHVGDGVPLARRQRAGDDAKVTQSGAWHVGSFHAVRNDTERACSSSQSRKISRRGGGSTASG